MNDPILATNNRVTTNSRGASTRLTSGPQSAYARLAGTTPAASTRAVAAGQERLQPARNRLQRRADGSQDQQTGGHQGPRAQSIVESDRSQHL